MSNGTPPPSSDQVARWAIFAVVFAAIVALVLVAFGAFGIPIPPFVVTIGWILVVALVVIVAIRFIARLF
jgi:hypothetical protein